MRRGPVASTAVASLVAVAACAAGPGPVRVPLEPPKAHANAPSVRVLEDLAMMATGSPLGASADDERTRIQRGESTVAGYVDRLLADPRFARDVAPEILFDKRAVDVSEENAWQVLHVVTRSGDEVYYLRNPCDPSAADDVHPWWAMETTVKVCPEAHQPAHVKDGRTGWYCSGDNLDKDRSPFCGCGPNLMNCAKDEDGSLALRRALRDEVTRTVAWIVGSDQPLDRIFTTNETVRTRDAELLYRRWRVMAGLATSVGDLRGWPSEGKLAPRDEAVPGQHAGLLTTPHMLLFGDTPRARMRNFFSDLWCVSPSSVDVTTEQVLGLGATDLRDGDGWQKLAAMPVCTGCHARLDYGMQFFAGYPSSFVGVLFDPARQPKGTGPLYGDDLHDRRGEAELSPRGFASIAVKQPEFFTCMARDVSEHVFNDAATREDERAIAGALRRSGTLRAMMKEALVRYAERAAATGRESAPDAGADVSRTTEDGSIVLGVSTRQRLDAACKRCHDEGEHAFLRAPAIPRTVLEKMLVEVAWEGMPKPPSGIDAVDRRAIVRGLVLALWADGATRDDALRYFEAGVATLPVHRGSALARLVEARASARDEEAESWAFSDEDRHDTTMYTPSFALTFAYATLRMCKAAGHTGAALDACLQRAAAGDVAVKLR